MTIQIYNTLTRTKQPLETIEPGVVRMYVCGVTVYDNAHIGHAMSALVFDIIRRYLEYRGYEVRHVVNFTDVDDKIINRANALGRDPKELAELYVAEFFEELKALNILPAKAYPRATETMPEIIRFIADLIENDHAYAAGGDVYFRVASDPNYGKLSGRNLQDMLAGTRFEVDERKENAADFALWKAAKPGEPFWPSPWSDGRPGWHIECSAMNLKELGRQIDIHGGGNDLVFPHHENEIAQTESLTGEEFARFWVHNGMLQIHTRIADGTIKYEKMSKSLGNVVNISDFLREHDADVLRLIVLSSYYRSPLLYGTEIVADQERKLARLRSALEPASGTTDRRRSGRSARRDHCIQPYALRRGDGRRFQHLGRAGGAVRAGARDQHRARLRPERRAVCGRAGGAARAGRRAGAATCSTAITSAGGRAVHRAADRAARRAAQGQTVRAGRYGAHAPDRAGYYAGRWAAGDTLEREVSCRVKSEFVGIDRS